MPAHPTLDPGPPDPVGIELHIQIHVARHQVGKAGQRVGQQPLAERQESGVGR